MPRLEFFREPFRSLDIESPNQRVTEEDNSRLDALRQFRAAKAVAVMRNGKGARSGDGPLTAGNRKPTQSLIIAISQTPLVLGLGKAAMPEKSERHFREADGENHRKKKQPNFGPELAGRGFCAVVEPGASRRPAVRPGAICQSHERHVG